MPECLGISKAVKVFVILPLIAKVHHFRSAAR